VNSIEKKIENVPAILAKHGSNLHSIYVKVCKKYDQTPEPEYGGPKTADLEAAIERLGDMLKDSKTAQVEFSFHLDEALDAGEKLMMNQDELQDRNANLENMIESARQAAGEQSALQQARMQGEINGLVTENKRLGKDKVQLLQLKHDLEDRINELMGERDKDGDLILKLNDDIEQMKQKIMNLEETHQKSVMEHNDTLESTKTRLTRQLTWAKQTADEDQAAFKKQFEEMQAEAQNQINELTGQVNSLTEQLDAERDDNRKLGKHKVQLLQVRRDLEEKVEGLERERDQDGDLILKLNDDIEKCKGQIADLQSQKANLEREREQDGDLILKLNEDIESAKRTIETRNRTIESKNDSILDLQQQKANLEGEREQDGDLIIKLNDDIEQCKQQIEAKNRTIQSQSRTIDSKNDTISDLQGQKGNLEREREQDGDLIIKLNDDIEQLKQTISERDDFIASLEGRIANLENERDQDGDLILRLNDDIENLKGKCAGLQGELSETQDLFDKTVASDLKKYNDSVAKYEGQLKDLREEKLDEKVRYENQIQMLTEDAANTKQTFEEHIEDIQRSHSIEKKKATMLLQETTSDYETKLTVMREDTIDQKIRFESEVKGLQDELLMTQGDLDTTNSQKERLESKLAMLESERDKDGDLILRLNDDCERFTKKIEQLEGHKTALTEEYQKHRIDAEKRIHETKSTLTRQMTFVEEQSKSALSRAQQEKQESDSHATEKIRSMNIRISELTDHLEMERTENGKKVAAYNILKKKFDNQEKEMERIMDDLITKTNKIRDLERSQRSAGTSDAGDQAKRQARLQNLRIQELELEIERVNRTNKSKVSELEETCRLFQRDLEAQKNVVTQLTREKEQLLNNMNSGDGGSALNDMLQQKLVDTQRKYEQSNETVIRLDEALRGALAKQDDFTSKITELKEEIMRLQRKTSRAESFISENTLE